VLPTWRKLLYSALTTVLAALFATAALALLQQVSMVEFARSDELAHSGLVNQLRVERGWGVIHFSNEDAGVRLTFPTKKSPQSLRVVLVGGSMAKGVPYVHCQAGDVPRWMEAILRARYPSREIAVVNAGVGGLNSYGVVKVVEDIARLRPDVVVVLTGNNEGYVPDLVDRTLGRWLVYRAMRKVLLGDVEPAERPPYYEQDESVEELEELYRAHIEQVVQLSQRKRFDLVLSTVPINLKWSGNQIATSTEAQAASGFPTMEPDEHIDRGLMYCHRGDRSAAIEAFSASGRPYVAGLALGQCLEQLGETDRALQTYRDLVQAHPMGRARPSFNDIVRELAESHPDVVLADADAAYRGARSDGVPDPDLFVDNCHMTAQGYYLVARQVVDSMVAAGTVPAGPEEPLSDPTIDELIVAMGWTQLFTQECPPGIRDGAPLDHVSGSPFAADRQMMAPTETP